MPSDDSMLFLRYDSSCYDNTSDHPSYEEIVVRAVLFIVVCLVAVYLAVFASASPSKPSSQAGRPETVDPLSGMIIPAQPAVQRR